MEGPDGWKFVEELNVFQIALLLGEYDPSPFERIFYSDWQPDVADAVAPHLTSLKGAVRTGRLDTLLQSWDSDVEEINWSQTLIDVQVLRQWLLNKGMTGTFFDLDQDPADGTIDFGDLLGEFYSHKLVAAVEAWTAVARDPRRLRGRSPKQAIEMWLTENAARLGLVNRDGSINRQGIEDVAKVVNWQPGGGAPKTPTVLPEPSSPSLQTPGKVLAKPSGGFDVAALDEDVPF